jgi:hypothetical protein
MSACTGDSDPRSLEIVGGPAGNGSIAEGSDGGQHTEEDVSVSGLGSAVLQVIDHGLTDCWGKRVGRGMARLALRHTQAVTLPVEIIQGQGSHLVAAKAIGDQQEENCVVSLPGRRAPIDHCEHLSDLTPRDRPWNVRVPVVPREFDAGTEVARNQLLAVEVAKEDAQYPAEVAHGIATEVPPTLDDERAEDGRREIGQIVQLYSRKIPLEVSEVVAVVIKGAIT